VKPVGTAGPVETTRFTAEPDAAAVPASGLWLMTLPEATVLLVAVVTVPTVSPAPVIAVDAAACVSPTTLGTLTAAGPVETTRLTGDPDAALAPAIGLWLMTLPEATVLLVAVATVPTVKPTPVIAVDAAACVNPTTFGTDTGTAAVTVTLTATDVLPL